MLFPSNGSPTNKLMAGQLPESREHSRGTGQECLMAAVNCHVPWKRQTIRIRYSLPSPMSGRVWCCWADPAETPQGKASAPLGLWWEARNTQLCLWAKTPVPVYQCLLGFPSPLLHGSEVVWEPVCCLLSWTETSNMVLTKCALVPEPT